MTYVPHSAADRRAMLDTIGARTMDDLFDAIPPEVKYPPLKLPRALSEIEILHDLETLSETNADLGHYPSFLGAGAYNHYVPSVVDHVISRSEFFTAYTPYQPELSQGTLQTIFEYQSMICALTGMEVANASHYDGATAAAEAVIMALSASRGKRRKAVVSPYVHPEYRATICTYTQGMGVEVVGDDPAAGAADLAALVRLIDDQTSCVIVQNPDFLGRLESPAALVRVAEAARAAGALFVVSAYPISLGMLVPPGEYGADIVIGEGQALGNGLNYGGPYLGYFACKEEHVRRMAGRLVGETVDVHGTRGYVLTLSTREQHIRREKATSNICTNEALNALMAGVYLVTLGKCGLARVAELCYHKAHYTADRIASLPGFSVSRQQPFFNEFVVNCPRPVAELNRKLLARGFVGGFEVNRFYPGQPNAMLVAVTEMNSRADIDRFVETLGEVAR